LKSINALRIVTFEHPEQNISGLNVHHMKKIWLKICTVCVDVLKIL